MDKWQEEDCKRVAALFEGVNRAAFAREHSVPGGQAMIYQHIRSLRPVGLDAAVAYAKGFKLDLSAVSPTLAAKVREVLVAADARQEVAADAQPDWPFRDISPNQWGSISAEDRGRVEGYAKGFVERKTGEKSQKTAA